MPRIQEYQAKTTPQGPVNSGRASASNFGYGEGVERLGRAISNVGALTNDFAKERAGFDAQKKLIEEQQNLMEFMESEKKKAPLGATGFTDKIKSELETRKNTILDSTDSGYETEILSSRLGSMHVGMVQEAMQFEAGSAGKKQSQEMGDIFNKNSNLVRSNPKNLENLWIEEQGLIDSTIFWDEQTKGQVKNKRKNDIYDSALDGVVTGVETNPNVTIGNVQAAIADMKNTKGKWINNASEGGYSQNLKRLERLQETLSEKENQQIASTFAERMAQMETTGVDQGLFTEAWLRDNIRDPVKRDAMIKAQGVSRAVASEVNQWQDKPITEVIAALDPKDIQGQLINTDEFNRENSRLQTRAKVASRMIRNYQDDPAKYINENSTAVKNIYEKLTQSPTPEVANQYVETIEAEQRRLFPGYETAILTKTQIGQVANQMAAVAKDDEGTTEALTVLQQQKSLWGKHWPKAVRDLKANKAINDSQYVAAGMLGKPESKHIAEDLVRASSIKKSVLEKQIPDFRATKTAIESEVQSELGDLKNTLSSMKDGPEIYASYVNAITQLALYKEATTGDYDVEEYADKVILNDYHFEGTYRVPKDQDPGMVNDALDRIKKEFKSTKFHLPTDNSNFIKDAQRQKDVGDRYLSSIKSKGTFVNTGDGMGLRLIDEFGRQVYEEKNGKTIPMRWDWINLKGAQ
jgi:hypothetical protein